MRFTGVLSAVFAASALVSAQAQYRLIQVHGPPKIDAATPLSGNSTFEQFIDHNNHSLGTFSQFYYYDDTFYSPGGPVILFTPGEVNVTGYQGYATTRTLTGLFAQAIGGAVIVLEHRYWGMSSPYDTLTAETLQYLTVDQAIKDLTHFAMTAKLPFDPKGTSRANRAPWILSGGSYSGALTAWVASVAPGTFWAYTATSAVVEAEYDFWQYFAPVQKGMPKNCSSDLSLVIDYVDSQLNGTAAEAAAVKDLFGLGVLEYPGDVGSALENGPWLWQGNQFYSNDGFFTMCDFVENANGTNSTIPNGKGVGLEKALAGYAYWFKEYVLDGYCGNTNDAYDASCFNSYDANATMYTDTSLEGEFRQWMWILCNEPLGFWQDGAPPNTPTIVSRFVTAAYNQRTCNLYFPTVDGYTFASATGKTEAATNDFTGGWNPPNTTRMYIVNGQYDPWRDATYSADDRPEGKLQSNDFQKVAVVPGGYHCSDLLARNGVVNAGVKKIQDEEVRQISEWVDQYYADYGRNLVGDGN